MTTVVVTIVLVMVLVSGRFIKYLADAAVGDIDANALLLIMALRLPEFLQMILPLSIYIAVLLVLGRLYVDHEMVVISACGISQHYLLRVLAVPTLVAAGLVAFLAFYLTPYGDTAVGQIFEEQRERSVLELLTPGRFHVRGASGGGYRATYAENLDRKTSALQRVFLAEMRPPGARRQDLTDAGENSQTLLVWADQGRIIEYEGFSYLELLAGDQYQGEPGDGGFRRSSFARALIRIGREAGVARPPKVRSWSTTELLVATHMPDASAELQWRFSLVLILPIMMAAAIPLSRVNPRQGRFGRLIPAVLVYMFYMGMLLVMRGRIADTPADQQSLWSHMLWVHAIALVAVLALYVWPAWSRWRRQHS